MERYDIVTTSFGYATQELRQLRHVMEQEDTRRHPKTTTQGFDFFMNLGAHTQWTHTTYLSTIRYK